MRSARQHRQARVALRVHVDRGACATTTFATFVRSSSRRCAPLPASANRAGTSAPRSAPCAQLALFAFCCSSFCASRGRCWRAADTPHPCACGRGVGHDACTLVSSHSRVGLAASVSSARVRLASRCGPQVLSCPRYRGCAVLRRELMQQLRPCVSSAGCARSRHASCSRRRSCGPVHLLLRCLRQPALTALSRWLDRASRRCLRAHPSNSRNFWTVRRARARPRPRRACG